MKLSQLIKELQDELVKDDDPEVEVVHNSMLYKISLMGNYDGNIVLYTLTKRIMSKEPG